MTQTISTPLEHHMIETNGVHLHVVQAGPPEGDVIIFLHGFPEFWYGWHKQIAYFAERGYRVWCPDQRGYNLSEKPSARDAYSLPMLVADVVGLINASGRERVYLVGHDWGAAVAWWVAALHPHLLHRLGILNVPHPSVMAETVRGDIRQLFKSWYIGFFQLPFLPEALLSLGEAQGAAMALLRTSNPGSFTDAELAEYVRAWKQPGALTAMLNWYRSLVQNPPPAPADDRVHVKTIILWGVNDVALTVEMAEKSAAKCDDARLVRFENATHWVQHDEPARVNALLYEFFRDAGV